MLAVILLGFAALVAIDMIGQDQSVAAAMAVPIGVAIIFHRLYVWPRICVSDAEILIVNPFGRRRLATSEVVSVEPGYSGLILTTRDGRRHVSWAIQQWNLMLMLGRQGVSDEVAQYILSRNGPADR